jgi:hypothetical protein
LKVVQLEHERVEKLVSASVGETVARKELEMAGQWEHL